MGFMALMAMAMAGFGMFVVQRPFLEALPSGLFILAIFAIVGLHVFISRLVLEGATLSSFRYGLRLWTMDNGNAGRYRRTRAGSADSRP